ncbi:MULTISPECIES: hypothetical protein [Desulfitobacterium]|uniref:Uncharacterized protein n=1 Tax=Desulfitobacterium chlororespirans DSM 11544 TaxID=1121395 RepID=A0A1M7UTV0_9FIRM|nr:MULTISPECIES: hypothetical protein [Desulfitobacterium]SHN86370.1 hypothetical protein SAMN02745215_04610 [Desulfitobacterium chlororespirans DSM 11544]
MAKNEQKRINTYFGRSVEDQMLWEYLQEHHTNDMATWLKYYARIGIMNTYKSGRTRLVAPNVPSLPVKPQPISPQVQSPEEGEGELLSPVVKTKTISITKDSAIVDVDAGEITVVETPTMGKRPASSATRAESADLTDQNDALDILNDLDIVIGEVDTAKNLEQRLSRFIPVEEDEDVLKLIRKEGNPD